MSGAADERGRVTLAFDVRRTARHPIPLRRARLAVGVVVLAVALLPTWACLQSYAWPIDDIALVGSDRVQTRLYLAGGVGTFDLRVRVGSWLTPRFSWLLHFRVAYASLATTGTLLDPRNTIVLLQLGSSHLPLLAAPSLAAAIWLARRLRRLARATPPGECPGCGYDLRATPDRCPECGRPAAP